MSPVLLLIIAPNVEKKTAHGPEWKWFRAVADEQSGVILLDQSA